MSCSAETWKIGRHQGNKLLASEMEDSKESNKRENQEPENIQHNIIEVIEEMQLR